MLQPALFYVVLAATLLTTVWHLGREYARYRRRDKVAQRMMMASAWRTYCRAVDAASSKGHPLGRTRAGRERNTWDC